MESTRPSLTPNLLYLQDLDQWPQTLALIHHQIQPLLHKFTLASTTSTISSQFHKASSTSTSTNTLNIYHRCHSFCRHLYLYPALAPSRTLLDPHFMTCSTCRRRASFPTTSTPHIRMSSLMHNILWLHSTQIPISLTLEWLCLTIYQASLAQTPTFPRSSPKDRQDYVKNVVQIFKYIHKINIILLHISEVRLHCILRSILMENIWSSTTPLPTLNTA